VGVRGFQWVESTGFQPFGRTSEETVGGNNEWLGATYRSHAVAVAIPFLLIRSRPLPEAVTPFSELRCGFRSSAHIDTVGGNGRERIKRNGTQRNDQNPIGNAFSDKRMAFKKSSKKTREDPFVL
jgi:hypothetical protein